MLNKAQIIGRLGGDPESRATNNGGEISSFSVATSEKWKDKNTGNMNEKTEWHNCVCFGNLAGIARQYLKKGNQVYIEGKLQTDKYDDKQGITRYSTKIIVQQLKMLGSKSDNQQQGQAATHQQHQQQQHQQQQNSAQGYDASLDDDIPF